MFSELCRNIHQCLQNILCNMTEMYIIDHSCISSSSDAKSYCKYYLIYLTVPVTLMLKVWIVQKKEKEQISCWAKEMQKNN